MSLWMTGFNNVFSLYPLLACLLGTVVGIFFGAIPGLTAVMAVALCLPMTFGIDPVVGMSLLCGLYIGGISGGLISAILINIPGSPASVASTFDGHPMAARGDAGVALGVGIFYSFLGSLFGLTVLFFLAPPLARFAVRFGSFEYFSVAIFALMLVAGLSGRSLAKGIGSALVGMAIAMIGLAPIDSCKRFTFGLYACEGGIALLTLLVGIFAVSEILKEAETSRDGKRLSIPHFQIPGFMGVTWPLFRAQLGNLFRSGLIGTMIGILPGIGAATSNLLSYLAAKNCSKYPERFGTGIPDGIIASETANNAGIGGSMVTLIALGIPGDAVTAMILGGFLMHGIQPGPLLFKTNGDLVYSIFVALLVANFMMVALQYFGIRVFVRLLQIPKHYLMPIIMVMCVIGAYGLNNRIFDVIAILAIGILGHACFKFNYPKVPLLLGFILGPMIEYNLRTSLMTSHGAIDQFFTRPISCVFLILTVMYLLLISYKAIKNKNKIIGT